MSETVFQMEHSTREQIPSVALELFADQGYEATSMRQIAERLNITKAALYYHFASKEDIVRAVVDTMLDQTVELVKWAKTQEVTPELRREVLDRWAEIMHAHGLRMFRFLIANQKVMRDIRPDKSGMPGQLAELYKLLTPQDASVEDQLKLRLSLMSIGMIGMVAADIHADDDEVLRAARHISAGLLPDEL